MTNVVEEMIDIEEWAFKYLGLQISIHRNHAKNSFIYDELLNCVVYYNCGEFETLDALKDSLSSNHKKFICPSGWKFDYWTMRAYRIDANGEWSFVCHFRGLREADVIKNFNMP